MVGAAGLEFVDDLLDGDDRSAGSENRLSLDPGDSPKTDVAFAIGLLGMDDGHVGVQGGNRCQFFTGERAGDGADIGVVDQVGADVPAEDREGQPGGPGRIPGSHPGMGVLFDLERTGMPVLYRIAEPVQRTDTGVATPGEHQPGSTAHPDHLVVDQIGSQSDQRETGKTLTDDLVTGSEGDQVGETFHGHRVVVVDQFGDGILECCDFCHL